MGREDYLKYYIQGSDHYLIPKDIFDELFNEMINWKKEAHQYKGAINKIKKICESTPPDWSICGIEVVSRIENVLKEEE